MRPQMMIIVLILNTYWIVRCRLVLLFDISRFYLELSLFKDINKILKPPMGGFKIVTSFKLSFQLCGNTMF